MSRRVWTLVDVDRDVFVDALSIEAGSADAARYSVRKRTLRGGLRDGVDAVEIDNGALRFTVVPTRGMGLWKAWHGELELGWQSPVKGPVHPKFVPVNEASGIGWLNGFDELLCRCGLEFNGAPEWGEDGRLVHALHGKIANTPAHRCELSIDEQAGTIELVGAVDEARLFGNNLRLESAYSTHFGSSSFTLVDRITNLGSTAADLELLYHINVGRPLVSAGATVHAAVKKLVPRTPAAAAGVTEWQSYSAGKPAAPEQVFFFELLSDQQGRTPIVLQSAHGERGLQLAFGTHEFAYFALWKNQLPDGDGYVTGLEPCINFPNPKSFEKQHGRVAVLAPGETRSFTIEFSVLVTAEEVSSAREHVAALQNSQAPEIHFKPTEDWCA